MKVVAAFISDHGFGHAARSTVVLLELLKRDCQIVIISAVPQWFFDEKFSAFPNHWQYIHHRVDVGLYQISGVESDYVETITALHRHWDGMDESISFILSKLSSLKPDLVYFDITAMGVLVAQKLAVPAIGFGNFSWDWIYDDLIDGSSERIAFSYFRDLHRQVYAKTDLLLTLPYSGDFSAFKCPQVKLPWVGNFCEINRTDILEKLKVDPTKKFALYSFGGHDMPGMNVADWDIPSEWNVLLVGHGFEHEKSGIHCFTNAEVRRLGVSYTEIVAAVDVVVTKPGYGIVTDCIFNKTPVLHVERGQFAEYSLLLKAMDETLSHHKLPLSQVLAGNIFSEAETLLSKSVTPNCHFNGSKLAADQIIELLSK